MKAAFVALALSIGGAQASPFNTYSVHLEPTTIDGGCGLPTMETFGNRAYRFRGAPMWPFDETLVLQNGRYVERNSDGSPEWEARLSGPTPIALGTRAAVILEITAAHQSGPGAIGYVLVVQCATKAMKVLFEASGPVSDLAYSRDGLRIAHYEWVASACRACPSREVTEQYRWQSKQGRFALANRSERTITP